jgi:hypothetical protein
MRASAEKEAAVVAETRDSAPPLPPLSLGGVTLPPLRATLRELRAPPLKAASGVRGQAWGAAGGVLPPAAAAAAASSEPELP